MVSLRIMIALYILYLVSIAFGGKINENGEENPNEQNTTTLYPVKNLPLYLKDPKVQENVTKVVKDSNDEQTDVATSKHTIYTHTDLDPNLDQFKEVYKPIKADKPFIVSNSNESKNSDMNDKVIPSKEDKIKTNKEGTRWKIDATYAPSKLNDGVHDESQFRDSETKDKTKDFKPSPHLGSFYDDSFVVQTPATEGSFTPFKPQKFGSIEKDFYKTNYKRPVDSYQTPIDTPYRIENGPHTPDWRIESGLEPRLKVVPPMKIPAGGLYKFPDAFQEKPSSDGDNDDFGLEFKDQKDNSVKKRGNPWKSFLHMVTALLPVGLIVSALTPNVIKFENTDNNNPYFPSRVSRSADDSASSPPRISERCKRRLLCEIHADQNYISNLSVSQRKPCYKLRCEDPHTMSVLLRWLFDHHHQQTHPTPGYRPADNDRRGYIIGN